MYMRMQQQVLSPGMQNAEEANVSSEVFRVRRNFQQGGRTSSKQQIVEELWIVLTQRIQFMR